jgi:pheromone shutdown protein TraB
MRPVLALAVVLVLSACGMVGSMGELQNQSSAAETALENELGVKPFIGWHTNNGVLTNVTVTFAGTKLNAMSVADIQAHVRKAIVASFKELPKQLVVSFSVAAQPAPN